MTSQRRRRRDLSAPWRGPARWESEIAHERPPDLSPRTLIGAQEPVVPVGSVEDPRRRVDVQ